MAFTDESGNGMVMPVSPMGGYGNNGFGGDWAWIILLLLLGWGNNGWGGNGFDGGAGGLYPWMNQAEITTGGFRDQMLNTNVTSIRDSIGNLSTQLCNCCGDMQMSMANGFAGVNQGMANGFAGVQQSLCSGFADTTAAINGAQNAIAQQMYGNELASLNRSFAEQTANMQGFNGVNSGIADLRYTVATEACADRAAVGDALQNVTMQNMGNTNQIVNAINGGIQSIKDQLCQYRDDQKNETIANLRQELMYSRGQASQTAQTAQILAGQAAEIDGVYNRLKNCPVGTYQVCNPLSAPYAQGCGCGGNF